MGATCRLINHTIHAAESVAGNCQPMSGDYSSDVL